MAAKASSSGGSVAKSVAKIAAAGVAGNRIAAGDIESFVMAKWRKRRSGGGSGGICAHEKRKSAAARNNGAGVISGMASAAAASSLRQRSGAFSN
jgi:hypothetical protein